MHKLFFLVHYRWVVVRGGGGLEGWVVKGDVLTRKGERKELKIGCKSGIDVLISLTLMNPWLPLEKI